MQVASLHETPAGMRGGSRADEGQGQLAPASGDGGAGAANAQRHGDVHLPQTADCRRGGQRVGNHRAGQRDRVGRHDADVEAGPVEQVLERDDQSA